jgi:hypothetical protein
LPISLLQSAGGFGVSSLKPTLLTSLTASSHVLFKTNAE